MSEPIDFNNLDMLFPYLDETPNFAMGFECGKIYGQMIAKAPRIEAVIHLKNWEQLKLIVASAKYEAEFVSVPSGTMTIANPFGV